MLEQINNKKGLRVCSVTEYGELEVLMPLFMQGFREMKKRQRFDRITEDGFVKTLLGVLGSQERNGIMVAFDERGPKGFGVALDDSGEFDDFKSLLLWSIYVIPGSGKGVAKGLYEAAERWAKERDYRFLDACNSRFTGSSFKFFEELFGMRRAQVIFTKEIK